MKDNTNKTVKESHRQPTLLKMTGGSVPSGSPGIPVWSLVKGRPETCRQGNTPLQEPLIAIATSSPNI